ncbi:hypothetical protein PVT67_06005 [Gallaecimonas kandeliae]|uniref:haloacid dehalogenase-like hydrolase n=1 Tax=Gallaecimonas kandeliae TaxID=3029055 RepID=UPI00264A36F9|nr:haloacid dehalogenase-like hydrolase [Gallaecimonas kandeliae]WKE66791.1 hypothetical protein PVT67_06005 [Gallaecimonas kandeliae]
MRRCNKNELLEVSVFDVCGTLYRSNTTFDFIRYFRKGSLSLTFLDVKIVKIPLLLIGKVLGIDLYRLIFIRLLKGFSRLELDNAAESFYDNFLSGKKINEVHFLLEDEKLSGKEIALCSASLDLIISVISRNLEVDNFYATNLLFNDQDICKGSISNDLLGRKDTIFSDTHELDLVATDNKSDKNIIMNAKRKYIVSTTKDVSFWLKNKLKVDLVVK